ncbi:MAG TPA: hypothetical protein VF765_09960 [Polyangiaceae bacterium]
MTHRDFLIWLQPRLEKAATTGLNAEALHEIRDLLTRMQDAGTLQPFASKMHNLVRGHATLDAKTVGDLAREVRSELAPPRERTVVFSAPGGEED